MALHVRGGTRKQWRTHNSLSESRLVRSRLADSHEALTTHRGASGCTAWCTQASCSIKVMTHDELPTSNTCTRMHLGSGSSGLARAVHDMVTHNSGLLHRNTKRAMTASAAWCGACGPAAASSPPSARAGCGAQPGALQEELVVDEGVVKQVQPGRRPAKALGAQGHLGRAAAPGMEGRRAQPGRDGRQSGVMGRGLGRQGAGSGGGSGAGWLRRFSRVVGEGEGACRTNASAHT